MKDLFRNTDAAMTFVMKLFFVHDFVYNLAMLPLEAFAFNRHSDALISSKGKNRQLHMGVNRKLLKVIKSKDYLTEDAAILIALKNSFMEGLLKLDFNDNTSYSTEVNERFYHLLSKELSRNKNGFHVEVTGEVTRMQASAKLLIISSSYLWKCIRKKRLKQLIDKLTREEKVLKIKISKPIPAILPHVS